MFHKNKKTILIASIGIILASFSTYLVILGYKTLNTIPTFATETSKAKAAGAEVQNDIQALPTANLTDQGENYEITDSKANGPTIQVKKEGEEKITESPEDNFVVDFPKEYSKKIEIKLDEQRSFSMTDSNGDGFNLNLFSTKQDIKIENPINQSDPLLQKENPKMQDILQYQDQQKRKSIYYAYQRDTKNQQRKVKNWIVYSNGNGTEKEQYSFENVKLKKNSNGDIEGFYFGQQDVKNEEVKAQVDSNLFERAKIALQKDEGADIENGNKTPDFIIPRPYFVDAQKNKTNLDWELDSENSKISINFSVQKSQYPLALDPTISFVAPGISSERMTITGEDWGFGSTLAVGDFNADGKVDLAVGCKGYNVSTGRVYIFYNDTSIPTTAATADVIINGETLSIFGGVLTAGDLNANGKNDLIVSGTSSGSTAGRVYVFYADGTNNFGTATCTGSSPTVCNAVNADVLITGENIADMFGYSLAVGDLNADGTVDLAIGAYQYSSYAGRSYVFYGSNSLAVNIAASVANVIISAEGTTNNKLGSAVTAGDFNADGKTDLAVGAEIYASAGRVYVFYADGTSDFGTATCAGTLPKSCAAANADVIISSVYTNFQLGNALIAGDINADGKTDLIVGTPGYNSSAGAVYFFYGGGLTARMSEGSANFFITGEGVNANFGGSLAVGDLDGDGKVDLVVGAFGYNAQAGRAYIFYNDGSVPTSANMADVIIKNDSAIITSGFGGALAVSDFNGDQKVDLVIGYNGGLPLYFFYSNNGFLNGSNRNSDLVGANYNDSNFGNAMIAGDFNADGRIDLAVGESGYSSSAGRVYIFYNDGSIPNTAATADVIIGGETNSVFGASLAALDFNLDGKMDLAVGATGYASYVGRVYVFYNDGSLPVNASGAEFFIDGEAGGAGYQFGQVLTTGDLNGDTKTDLAVGTVTWNNGVTNYMGRVYIFNVDFAIPVTAATADVIITGEATINGKFGTSMTVGDFNGDGKNDLVVGAIFNLGNGKAYIFYGTNLTSASQVLLPLSTLSNANVIITGSSSILFGTSMAAGDFNNDGLTDLAVAAKNFSNTGKVYVFYYAALQTAAPLLTSASVLLAGDATSNAGLRMIAGDFNGDNKIDLAFSSDAYTSNTGRVYIFKNNGTSLVTTPSVIISGDGAGGYFGNAMVAGDFNFDGGLDLAVGAYGYGTSSGRAYVFYGTRFSPASQVLLSAGTSSNVDVTIKAQMESNYFGYALTAGDFNFDGKNDLAVGAYGYNNGDGRVYLYYGNDGMPTNNVADAVIAGETGSNFGYALIAGDFDGNGRKDLAVGAPAYTTNTGRTYIFNNIGAYPATANLANVIITGEATSNFLGSALGAGDFGSDTKSDLAIGAYGFSSYTGKAYILYGSASLPAAIVAGTGTNVSITGEASSYFGSAFTAVDFNRDTKTDLVVGAYYYSGQVGRVYVFYGSGTFPTTAATANYTINGGASSQFGYSLTAADFNADGYADLVVGTGQNANIFYCDGTVPVTEATADVKIVGTSAFFGHALAIGDFNADGKGDLVVGAQNGSTAFVFYNDGSIPTTEATADVKLIGDSTSQFGEAIVAGDFNNDGIADLAIGEPAYNNNAGLVYYFLTKFVKPAEVIRGNIQMRGNVNIR
ncbi:MAG: FG-GAP-like repeat-containing protein [bacterium]